MRIRCIIEKPIQRLQVIVPSLYRKVAIKPLSYRYAQRHGDIKRVSEQLICAYLPQCQKISCNVAMLNMTYEYKLEPTTEQSAAFDQWLNTYRKVWNYALRAVNKLIGTLRMLR